MKNEYQIVRPYLGAISELPEIKKSCEKLRRRDNKNLGFIPSNAYRDAAMRDRLFLVMKTCEADHTIKYENLLGFVYYGIKNYYCTIYQIVVKEDYRREGLATMLLEAVEKSKQNEETESIKLKVRADIRNGISFWEASGFIQYEEIDEGSETGNTMLHYSREIRKVKSGLPDSPK